MEAYFDTAFRPNEDLSHSPELIQAKGGLQLETTAPETLR